MDKFRRVIYSFTYITSVFLLSTTVAYKVQAASFFKEVGILDFGQNKINIDASIHESSQVKYDQFINGGNNNDVILDGSDYTIVAQTEPLTKTPKGVKGIKSKLTSADIFNGVLEITKKYYVEEVDDQQALDAALDGMLKSLDPHSGYLTVKEFEDMVVNTSGEFDGIGIEITKEESLVKVISPIEDTPAFKAGLKSGDYITHVDGESIVGAKLTDVVQRIRGKQGTVVKLSILRSVDNKPGALEFDITRDVIELIPVKSSVKLDNILYLKITSFTEKTTKKLVEEYNKQLEVIGEDNVKGIVLDLRNNPGGLLDQSIKVTDFFIDSGLVVVSTKDRSGKGFQEFKSKTEDMTNDLPMVVLINQGSASASEIVSGALQDYSRALVVGIKSFGKGSVQRILPLINGGALKLTTSRYYTPSGSSIQGRGIYPDVYVKQDSLTEKEDKKNKLKIVENQLSKALVNEQLTDSDEDLAKKRELVNKKLAEIYKSDYQLGRSIDLLNAIHKIKE